MKRPNGLKAGAEDDDSGQRGMTTFDFFDSGELPAPAISVAAASEIAERHFGLHAVVTALGSQQDANFLLRSPNGDPLGVLKIANPAFGRAEIEAQDAAARHIADADRRIRTANNAEPSEAPAIATVAQPDGTTLFARVLDYLDGGTLSGTGYIAPHRWAALGTLAGRASTALADFEHPGVHRVLQWDLRHADRTVALLLPYVRDTARGQLLTAATADCWRTVTALAAQLPIQVIHGDITDDNVVCSGTESALPDGIIDFGDLTRSWAVGELAIATSAVLRHFGGEPAATLPLITAFHRERPLSAAEVAALWPLVVLRAATLVVSGNQQVAVDPENDYAISALELEWQIFERSLAVPAVVMTHLIADAVGVSPGCADSPAVVAPSALLPDRTDTVIAMLDFGTESDALDGGRWLLPDAEDAIAGATLSGAATVAASRYGVPRLTRSRTLHSQSPATVPTGVDLWLADPVTLSAPWPGVVTAVDDSGLDLVGDFGVLHIRGDRVSTEPAATGPTVIPGEPLGKAAGRIWIQLVTGTIEVPDFVRPEYAPGWLALTRDPSELLGVAGPDSGASEEAALLVGRRGNSLATVQEQYYERPPRIERGWREFLLDTEGRSYLDMVNNVAAIGHGHPRLAQAIARQWRRLNTNSRFNYGAVVDFSERLAATLPDPLDTVFLVNSGSEAVDLALRLAFAVTDRRSVVAVREAYHGWTYATDAISTSVADNPNALTSRPEWVHTVLSPNSYRGRHRGSDAGRYAPEAVAIIEGLVAEGRPPAAFICEPFYGNAGGIALPDGYLDAVYTAVRAAGGVAIADEVQVGYGRLGRWFWGFQGQGVVPDIVTVAKAMGNGHPLGAVITTRAIAAAYRSQGYFFSSAGGSPVSSVVGLTVLDVLEQEELQNNALHIGDRLRNRLTELAERHRIIGAVHGSGLYLGVELVRDRETLEPAAAETAAICERMRELGVIVQPTGDHLCVLKIKPPMCISEQSADYFVDMLDEVLSTGW